MILSDLSMIVRLGYVHVSRLMAEFELTASESFILMYLYGHGASDQDSVAAYFSLDKGAVARSLAKLEEKGFVLREINRSNQRKKTIGLTEKAAAVMDKLEGMTSDWMAYMYHGISEEEISAFERTAKRIAVNLTK